MAETQIVAAREEHKYYPYQGIFYVFRNSFWQLGQDSFTQPPAQNPDMFFQVVNAEPILQGTVQRRRGYQQFYNNGLTNPFPLSYSYRNDSQTLRQIISTSTSNVLVTSEFGDLINGSLFTPSPNATSASRMVLSTNYGYFYDGIPADCFKWDGTLLTKTGINVGNISGISFGPSNPANAANVIVVPGSVAWSNPSNAAGACNGTLATVTISRGGGTSSSQALQLTNLGLSIPATSIITGIQVSVTYQAQSVPSGSGNLIQVLPVVGGVGKGIGTPLPSQAGLGAVTIGGPNNLLGLSSLTPAQANAGNFGMQFTAGFPFHSGVTSLTASIDCISVTVFVAQPPLTVGAPGSGNINLLSGRTYFYAFQNSKTGHTSGLSSASLSTGPVTNANIPLSNIPANLDTQVDTVLILATADGGDQTTLYLVTGLANGTTTYTDNTPDALTAAVTSGPALLTNPLYQNTDSTTGNLHGIANNNTPPSMFFPVKYKGRIYGANGSKLFFSKSLDDVTTALGLITSKYEESWPAENTLDISEAAETVRGLLTDGQTLWIGTERAIHRLIGDSPSNFQLPEIQFNETGIYNQDVWKVVFYEGQPLGSMWLTPDLRVISSDFNVYQEVGMPIQDILNSINTEATFGPQASFYSDGPADYYILYVPTGTNIAPDTACVYNLRLKTWSIWRPADQVVGSLFLIDGSGEPRWFLNSASGPLYEWIFGLFTDRTVNGAGLTYPVTLQTSFMDFGDRNLRKALNQMTLAFNTSNSILNPLNVQVTILGATTGQELVNGNLVGGPFTFSVGPLQDYFVPLAGLPTRHRWYSFQITILSAANSAAMSSFSIEASSLLRY